MPHSPSMALIPTPVGVFVRQSAFCFSDTQNLNVPYLCARSCTFHHLMAIQRVFGRFSSAIATSSAAVESIQWMVFGGNPPRD